MGTNTFKKFALFALSMMVLYSCQTEEYDPWGNEISQPDEPSNQGNGQSGSGGSSTAGSIMDLGELASFDVAFDTSALSESETIPTSEDDTYYNEYIENNFSAKNTAKIVFSGTSATCTGFKSGDEYTINGADVTINATNKGLVLDVSGSTTSGSLKIYSDKKFELLLDGASITSTTGAAINIQSGNCFVVLQGTNTLSDSSTATYQTSNNEDMKAVFFSEDDIRFSGSGSLAITASNTAGKAGISCDDAIFIRPGTNISVTCSSSAGNAIKGNDAIVMKGGVLNLDVASKGGKGLSSDLYTLIDGGRLTVITSGGVDTSDSSDYSGAACIKSDSILDIKSGEIYLKSTGQGGKGISCDEDINIAGGKIRILTTGSHYGSSSNRMGQSQSDTSVSPKGIRGDKNINISGGDIMVRTSGTNGEGIESKAILTVSGGKTATYAYDDGVNASTSVCVTGGQLFAMSSSQADGIDSNGTISLTGGVTIGVASSLGSEEGIDLENSTFKISNATVIGIGGSGMGSSKYDGHYIKTSLSASAGDCITLSSSGSTPLVAFKMPRTWSNGTLVLSYPGMTSTSYTLSTGVTVTGGTQWINYIDGATGFSGGKSSTVKAN